MKRYLMVGTILFLLVYMVGCVKQSNSDTIMLEKCIEDIHTLQNEDIRYECSNVIAYRDALEIPVSSLELWIDHDNSLIKTSNSSYFHTEVLRFNGSTFMKNVWNGIDSPEECWVQVPEMNLTPSGIAGQALDSANCVFLSMESTPANRTVVFSQNDVNPVIEWRVSYDSEGNIVQIELSSSMELLDENGKVVPTPVVNFMEFEIGNSIIRDTILNEYTLAVEGTTDNNP